MRRWPFRARAALATPLVLIAGCRSESRSIGSAAPARPRLPEAGHLPALGAPAVRLVHAP